MSRVIQTVVDTLQAERALLVEQRAALDAAIASVDQALERVRPLVVETPEPVTVGRRVITGDVAYTALRAAPDQPDPPDEAPQQPAWKGARDRRASKVTNLQILNVVKQLGPDAAPGALGQRVGLSGPGLRTRLKELIDAGMLVVSGATRDRRLALGPLAPKPEVLREEPELETVWTPHRDAPSLTEGVPGLGTSLSGPGFTVRR